MERKHQSLWSPEFPKCPPRGNEAPVPVGFAIATFPNLDQSPIPHLDMVDVLTDSMTIPPESRVAVFTHINLVKHCGLNLEPPQLRLS